MTIGADKDSDADVLKGMSYSTPKWRALLEKPPFVDNCNECITLQTTAGDEQALDKMLSQRLTFNALQVQIPAATAHLNPLLQFVFRMRGIYEERFFAISKIHHDGLYSRQVRPPPVHARPPKSINTLALRRTWPGT